jgi:hypothetical protein
MSNNTIYCTGTMAFKGIATVDLGNNHIWKINPAMRIKFLD